MNERVLIALNKGEDKTSFDISLPDFYNIKHAVNLLTNEEVKIINNKMTVSLNGLSRGIFKLD